MSAVCAEIAGELCARAYAAFDELFDAMSETKTFAICSLLLVPKPYLEVLSRREDIFEPNTEPPS